MEKLKEKFFIGLGMRTSYEVAHQDIPTLWEKVVREKVIESIPNRVDGRLMVLYTEYEDDFLKPYTCLIGAEVSSLDDVPAGLTAMTIPEQTYDLFESDGPFPASLILTWQKIWSKDIPRGYTVDFEYYPADFDPVENPSVQVYIALK